MKRKVSGVLSIVMIFASLAANITAANAIAVDEYAGMEQWKIAAVATATDKPNYSVTINGVQVPFEDYPPDSTWDVWGYYTTHFGSARQCKGFALYAFEQIWDDDGTSDKTRITLGSATAAKNYINGLQPGTMIHSDRPHSMIYLGKDSKGVYVYHANWPRDNIVKVSHFTWANFASYFSPIIETVTPHDVEWTSITSKTHKGRCSNCGLSVSGRHMAEVAGMGTCMTCGYYGNMDGISKVDDPVKQ